MNPAEAQRRADEARSLQKAITYHLHHNGEHLDRVKAEAASHGLGVWVTLTKSGNLLFETTTDHGPGELEWRSVVADG